MGVDYNREIYNRLALRRVEFHILLSLASGKRHGYGIIQDIKARGKTSVPDDGTMYRALARMVDAGLIATAARWPAPGRMDTANAETTTAFQAQAGVLHVKRLNGWNC
jgi:hypothetical protein